MLLASKIWMGLRNVGDSEDEGTFINAPFNEAIKELIKYIAKVTMRKRIEICIATDEQTVRNQINSTRAINKLRDEEVLDEVDALMAAMKGIDEEVKL